MSEKVPCVYILSNRKNGTLYVGVTSNLRKRLQEHRGGNVKGFTKKYSVNRLVYYEAGDSMDGAILREKQIKGGSRKKKISLIELENPYWRDLYDEVMING